MSNFWHPFADVARSREDAGLVLVRGDGSCVWDKTGKRYVDATAQLWYVNVGYGRRAIAEAAASQMALLHATSTFGDMANQPVLDLADRVAALAPVREPFVFFTSGGSDSVETAAKMARRHWQLRDRPAKRILVSRQHAYHGMHFAGTSLAGIAANREGYGEMATDVVSVAWDDPGALEDAIREAGAERVAAFFCEPVIGAGGVYPPPPGYLEAVRDVCRRHEVLFVADEVVTGFARAGDWFASGRFGLEPDMIVCAKGITSGYLPLGAVVAAGSVWRPFADGNAWFRHGYTYSGHATCAAAALANLDIVEQEDLVGRAVELETAIPAALASLADLEIVEDTRGGVGALAAVQIDPERLVEDPGLPAKAVLAARENGVLTRALASGGLQVSPPLVLTEVELDQIAEGLEAALRSL